MKHAKGILGFYPLLFLLFFWACQENKTAHSSSSIDFSEFSGNELLQLSKQDTFSDSMRLALISDACYYASFAPDSYLIYANHLQEKAIEFEFPFYIAEAYIHQALAYRDLLDLEQSNQKLEEALAYIDQHNVLYHKADALSRLGTNYWMQNNYDKAMELFNEAQLYAEELEQWTLYAAICVSKGIIYQDSGNAPKGLEQFQNALKIYEREGNKAGISVCNTEMGIVYNVQGKQDEALKHYKRSLAIDSASENYYGMVVIKSNIAVAYKDQGKLNKALETLMEVMDLMENHLERRSDYSTETSIANVYMKMGERCMNQNDSAYTYYFPQAIKYFEIGISKALLGENAYYYANEYAMLGKTYLYLGDLENAEKNCMLAYDHAKGADLKAFAANACECLSDINQKKGNYQLALDYKIEQSAIEDSVLNRDNIEQLKSLEMSYQFDRERDSIFTANMRAQLLAEAEKKRQRNLMGVGIGFVGFVALGLFSRYRVLRRKNAIIAEEKERSESLLLNILPQETAEELKLTGKAKAHRFEQVTVLFSDIKDFTTIGETFSPEELVFELNHCFSAFDELLNDYRVEKIKTVGDAYICAGGLPSPYENSAKQTLELAIKMQQFMQEYQRKRKAAGKPFFQIRIGLHTGPVVAGIVGIKKFAYDIWGDTVNTAARMEQNCEVGEITLSESTAKLVSQHFPIQNKGKVEVKGKGSMDLFYLPSGSI